LKSLYACDYSQPHLDYDEWKDALKAGLEFVPTILNCVYDYAYREKDQSE